MTSPRILRHPADLAVAIPELLGYFPERSLVAVPLAGKRGGALIRVDLPTHPRAYSGFADTLVTQLTRFPDCTRVAVIAFGEGDLDECEERYTPLIDALVEECDAAGIVVPIAVVRVGDAWCELGTTRRGTVDPVPSAPCVSLAELARIEPAPLTDQRELQRRFSAFGVEPKLDAALDAWRTLLDADPEVARTSYAEFAIIATALRNPIRAELLLCEGSYGDPVTREHSVLLTAIGQHAGERDRESAGSVLVLLGGRVLTERAHLEPIDLDRVARTIELLRRLAALAPRTHRAAVMAALAWSEWCRGGASLAEQYAETVEPGERGYALAEAVAQMARCGITPGWIGMLGVEGGLRARDYDALLDATTIGWGDERCDRDAAA